MSSSSKGFGATAERLSRNPLGIIALFIVLVYGIAALVFGVSAAHLSATEGDLIIGFLVLFPVLILGAFYRLVTHHHTKLYAPHDFPDKEGFFRALTAAEARQRLDKEIGAFEAETVSTAVGRNDPVEASGTFVNLRQDWALAEELALREIEREFGVPIARQVQVAGDVGVDGVFPKDGKFALVEIKFTPRGDLGNIIHGGIASVKSLEERLRRKRQEPSLVVLGLVVAGLQKKDQGPQIDKAREQLNTLGVPVQLRLYDFEDLKRKYGIVK